jgi:2-keto-4-pentenoate hydratase
VGTTQLGKFEQVISGLIGAYETGTLARLPSQQVGELTNAEAFAIQTAVLELRAGSRPALTKAIKAGLSDPPLLGRALGQDVVLDRGVIDGERLVAPLLEPELAFVIGERLEGDDLTVADVLRATEFVLPAFELVDRRIDCQGMPPITDIIADNGWLGLVVLGGSPARLTDLALADIAVELRVDGELVSQGRSNRPGANPAHAVVVVAALLHGVGLAIEPGQVVLTGACTEPLKPRRGSTVNALFRGLGDVEVVFS